MSCLFYEKDINSAGGKVVYLKTLKEHMFYEDAIGFLTLKGKTYKVKYRMYRKGYGLVLNLICTDKETYLNDYGRIRGILNSNDEVKEIQRSRKNSTLATILLMAAFSALAFNFVSMNTIPGYELALLCTILIYITSCVHRYESRK